MGKVKVVELTKENYNKYLTQVADLEEVVLNKMEKEGQEGQFFTTGYDDVLDYVLSNDNSVYVAVDENEKVLASAYITEGQIPYTYNDITKYFKTGEKYSNWVRSQYSSENEYKKDVIDAYKMKMNAYCDAKNKILNEYTQFKSIPEFLNHELNEENNGFHEKSVLRDKLNKYMSEYIKENGNPELYERFYWTTLDDIKSLFNKDIAGTEDMKEYENVLGHMKVDSIEEPDIKDISKYYKANTSNAVEIDTYITDPNARSSGIAKVLVYEGIKKYIDRHFNNTEQKEMYLCSTLHRLNVSSKYVSEFFGLKDSLFVNRRFGRTREVHIKKIDREEANQYLDNMYDKLAVLNGYNPENKKISEDTVTSILREEVDSRKNESIRLRKLKKDSDLNKKYHKYLHNRIMGNIGKAINKKKEINNTIKRKEGEDYER